MSDNTGSAAGIAGRYASALFEIAEESGALDAVEGQLGALKGAMAESADFVAFLKSPIISREEQGAAMAAIAAKMGIGAPVSSVLGLMAAKRRLFCLPQMIDAFAVLLAAKRGVVSAEVVSATPLTKEQLAGLEEAIKAWAGSDIALDSRVDAALIGGLVVKVGSKMIDASIRAKLDSLKTAMKEVG